MELCHTPEMQQKILALMYRDPDFLKFVQSSVKAEHFDSKIHQFYAQTILDYAERFPGTPMTKTVVFEEISRRIAKKEILEEESSYYAKAFVKLMTEPMPESAYVRESVIPFTISKRMEDALRLSVEHHGKGRYDEIVKLVTEAAAAGKAEVERPIIHVVSAFDELLEDLTIPIEEAIKTSVTTGIENLDCKLFAGGVDLGELLIFCGPPGRGKSVALMNAALFQIFDGKNVLYYSLEVGQKIYRYRMLSCLTGIPINDLRIMAREAKKQWNDLLEASKKTGELYFHDLPSRGLTPSDLRSDLARHQEQGHDIGSLVVDYADIMSSDKNYGLDGRRFESGDVYESLRAIAKTENIPVFSASQGNRASLNKREVDMDSLAEDFSKAMTADYLIGLSQHGDELKLREGGEGTGQMRLFVAKNRNGQKGQAIPVMTDYARMRLSRNDWLEFDKRMYGGSFRKAA